MLYDLLAPVSQVALDFPRDKQCPKFGTLVECQGGKLQVSGWNPVFGEAPDVGSLEMLVEPVLHWSIRED